MAPGGPPGAAGRGRGGKFKKFTRGGKQIALCGNTMSIPVLITASQEANTSLEIYDPSTSLEMKSLSEAPMRRHLRSQRKTPRKNPRRKRSLLNNHL